MKNKSKIKSIILILGIFFTLITINSTNISNEKTNKNESVVIQGEFTVKRPKKSATYSEPFIHIDGSIQDNWTATVNDNDWCSGNGSWGNPYIIENVTIDASSSPTGNGIFINNSKNDYFIIRNCIVTNAFSGGIKLKNTCNGTLLNNNCSYNDYIGIYIRDNSDNNTISGNIINNNEYGISLNIDCDSNTIFGNTANNSRNNGININKDCDENIISGNIAGNNSNHGIVIRNHSDNNTISGNIVCNNSENGIYIRISCNNNTISGNTINENFRGIDIRVNSTKNTIKGNFLNYNDYGIVLSSGSNSSIISGNLLKNSIVYGLYIHDLNCKNNLFYQNALIGTYGWHARDDGANNYWNNTGIGNYWDNHTSPDSDHDGIVDTTYTWITGGASSSDRVDHFPLAESPIHVEDKIHIDDSGISAPTWSRTTELNFWCTGSGSYSDPYIIDGLEVDGASLGSCILIENSSVFFIIRNCNVTNSGYTNYYAGIKLENVNNGKLINNNCSDIGSNGIYLLDSNNNTILGNTANDNKFHGIYLYDNCDDNIISENTANDNDLYGTYLDDNCDDNIISENTANDNDLCGIYLNHYCDDNIISENNASNTIINNQDYGIILDDNCDGNTISGNTVNENYYCGIYLNHDCDDNIISENTANDNNLYGIYLDDNCDDNIISENSANNTITNDQNRGIVLGDNCDGNTISGNTANENYNDGIFLYDYCDDNIISGNTANNHTRSGIYLQDDCNDNIISGNTVNNNTIYGIHLNHYCDDNIISENIANDNEEYGIYLSDNCDGNTISENLIYINKYGINLDTCQYNLIFKNYIFNNTLYNAIDSGLTSPLNNWDNGTLGNYWGNYTGTDTDQDGIGDIAVNITGTSGCIDHKPIMNYNPLFFNLPEDITYEFGTEGHSIRWSVINTSPISLPFTILRDGTSINTSSLDPYVTYIEINVDGLAVGSYIFTLEVEDGYGGTLTDTVWVKVTTASPSYPVVIIVEEGDDDDDDDDEEDVEFLSPTLIIVGIISAIGGATVATFLNKKRQLKLRK